MSIIDRVTAVVKSELATDELDSEFTLDDLDDLEHIDSEIIFEDNFTSSSHSDNVVVSGLKSITGIRAIKERRQALAKEESARRLIEVAEAKTQAKRDHLQSILDSFERKKLKALHCTVGTFLDYLNRMGYKYGVKEYVLLRNVQISDRKLAEMEEIRMNASEASRIFAKSGGFGLAALVGTPKVVSTIVGTLGNASTGTAISELSDAEITNAIMAWLGGGPVASGEEAKTGTRVLTGLSVAVIAVTAVAVIGSMASSYYSKKHTESEKQLSEVKKWAADLKWLYVYIDGIEKRAEELESIMKRLYTCTVNSLQQLAPIVDVFDPNNPFHVKIFQQCGLLVKSMSEIAQVPIMDETGNLNNQTFRIMAETEKVLNTQL